LAVAASAHQLRARPSQGRDRVLFLGTALAVAVTLYVLFLKEAGVEPRPWHFTPLLAFAALALEGVMGVRVATADGGRAAIVALVALGGLAVFPHADGFMRFRLTNIDRVAAILAERDVRGDLVVVSPYHCGVSFQRYYRGAAEWATLPPVEDHRVHRYDMVKSAMLSPDPLAPVLHRADEALRSGHKVFVVVDGPIFRHPPARPVTPAVPDPDWGWYAGMHFHTWALQFGFFLQTRATRTERVNPKLNAVIIQRFEKARAEAAAPDLPAGPSAPQRRAGSWGHAHRHARALATPAARGAGHARLVPSLKTLLDTFGQHHQ